MPAHGYCLDCGNIKTDFDGKLCCRKPQSPTICIHVHTAVPAARAPSQGEGNVIADALSRLPQKGDRKPRKTVKEFDRDSLDYIAAYCSHATTVLQHSDDFKRNFRRSYRTDSRASAIIRVLKETECDGTTIPYKLEDGILYMEEDWNAANIGVYMPRAMAEEVFRIV